MSIKADKPTNDTIDYVGVVINAVRDFAWTISTELGQLIKTQATVGTAAGVFTALGLTFYHIGKGDFTAQREAIWLPVAKASPAIVTWDLAGQFFGTLARGGIKGVAAASVAVGVAEGFTQWIIGYGYKAATDATFREAWCRRPDLMAKLLLKEFLLNTTIGAIPGAMWNLVFVATLFSLTLVGCPPLAAIVITAIAVAAAVAYCNVQFGQKAMSALNEFIEDRAHLEREYEELKTEIENKHWKNVAFTTPNAFTYRKLAVIPSHDEANVAALPPDAMQSDAAEPSPSKKEESLPSQEAIL